MRGRMRWLIVVRVLNMHVLISAREGAARRPLAPPTAPPETPPIAPLMQHLAIMTDEEEQEVVAVRRADGLVAVTAEGA